MMPPPNAVAHASTSNPRQIQVSANGGHRSFNPKKERARQVHRIEQPVRFRWHCFPRSRRAFVAQ
jgi:hypothetical protein